jgi:hypothetical protein
MKSLPPVEYLHECFSYCPETGELTWKVRPLHHFGLAHVWSSFNLRYANNKYRLVCIAGHGCHLSTHRIIWKMFHGTDPEFEIDHIDGNPSNNRIENLREATRSENMRNAPTRKRDKFGVKGAYMLPNGKFTSAIWENERLRHLGTFATLEEAKAAYDAAAKRLHGKFFRS